MTPVSKAENLDWPLDADTCYLLGLIVGRGTFVEHGTTRRLSVQFPDNTSGADGGASKDQTEQVVTASLSKVQNRIQKLLGTQVEMERPDHYCELVATFPSDTVTWRLLRTVTGRGNTFSDFHVPAQLLTDSTPTDYKLEFLRGFADVAGNVREANRYLDGRNRVRLDVLNFPSNWTVPVELCNMMQTFLDVPVQLIQWGHPDTGHDWREHQIDVFAVPFLKIGFGLRYKQQKLQKLAKLDQGKRSHQYAVCPGAKPVRKAKLHVPGERDALRLCSQLLDRHFDAYWQICHALGCSRIPPAGAVEESLFDPINGVEDGEL
ncbi:hypothetical protein LLF88_07325 [bacterium]|nr:hypothetical protein [bacterium]